ncbi:MAG: hypothetical protein OXE41_06320 [Gammaproteobacteria bacterium]|nr:hypothetical protein [Gammaproteobacteria bacterium]MCY4274994.1 hypothetical protein [Gammaproteobacteria bacterium]
MGSASRSRTVDRREGSGEGMFGAVPPAPVFRTRFFTGTACLAARAGLLSCHGRPLESNPLATVISHTILRESSGFEPNEFRVIILPFVTTEVSWIEVLVYSLRKGVGFT